MTVTDVELRRAGPTEATSKPTAVLVGGLVVLLAACALAFLTSLAVGARSVPLGDVLSSLFGGDDSFVANVIDQRWERTVLGLMVGASLAVSGAVIQAITRNPLGDPGILGINAGAATAVVVLAAATGRGVGAAGPAAALAGAILAALAVYAVGAGKKAASPVRLALAGAAVSAVLIALVQGITFSKPDVFDSYRFWVVGSLAGRGFDALGSTWPLMAAGLVLALLLGRSLNAMSLGEELARALGVDTGRVRIGGALAATLLAASATAAVGPIAFVGLAVPHVVRPFTGPDYRWVIPYSMVSGSILLLVADVIGRIAVPDGELMVGVVTALIGGPALLLIVRRQEAAL
ncbi:MAG: FecCD family ABC transporter permease [Acidimicrobiia bacterium]